MRPESAGGPYRLEKCKLLIRRGLRRFLIFNRKIRRRERGVAGDRRVEISVHSIEEQNIRKKAPVLYRLEKSKLLIRLEFRRFLIFSV